MTAEEGKLLERVVEHEGKRLGPGYNVSASSVLRRLLWEHASQLGFDDLPEPPGIDALKSVVYFLQSTGPSGVIKIGTTMHLTARIAAVQRDHPVPVKLVLTLPGSFKAERGFHLMFAHLRFEGEWFFPEPDLVGFIQAERAKQEAEWQDAHTDKPGKPGLLPIDLRPKTVDAREVKRDQPAPNGLADEDLDVLLKE